MASWGRLLGLALGAAGGLRRRSPRAAITAALIGLLLGAAAGAGTTFLILPWYHAYYALPSPDNAHQQSWASPWRRTAASGWPSAPRRGWPSAWAWAEGGSRGPSSEGSWARPSRRLIYEFAGAVVFPLERTYLPTAMAPAPRLLAHLAVALCVSAGTLWAADHLSRHRLSS